MTCETFEGTYFYERYPLTLKGIDAVIFAVFQALELTVHIKLYEVGKIIGGEIADAKMRFQGLSTEEATSDAADTRRPPSSGVLLNKSSSTFVTYFVSLFRHSDNRTMDPYFFGWYMLPDSVQFGIIPNSRTSEKGEVKPRPRLP
jgi:hypothetical protein